MRAYIFLWRGYALIMQSFSSPTQYNRMFLHACTPLGLELYSAPTKDTGTFIQLHPYIFKINWLIGMYYYSRQIP